MGMSPKPVVKAFDLEDKLDLKGLRMIDLQIKVGFVEEHGYMMHLHHALEESNPICLRVEGHII